MLGGARDRPQAPAEEADHACGGWLGLPTAPDAPAPAPQVGGRARVRRGTGGPGQHDDTVAPDGVTVSSKSD